MLLDRKQTGWVIAACALGVAAIGAYWWDAAHRIDAPSGGSTLGIALGAGAFAIMLFCAALSLKRKAPHWRLGRAQVWLRAHVWLGLLSVLLVALHSAFSVGGPLTAWLWVLLAVVTLSGALGILLQQFVPRLLLHSTPGETVAQQLDRQMTNLATLAEQVIVEFAGSVDNPAPPWPPIVLAPPPTKAPAAEPAPAPVAAVAASPAPASASAPAPAAPVAAVAVESAPKAASPAPPPEAKPAPVVPAKPAPGPAPPAGGEPLRRFYLDYLRDFLRGKSTPLRSPTRTESLFGALRTMTPPHIHPGIAELQEMCARRRVLIRQRRLMRVMWCWLIVHVPLSWGLLVLTAVHAIGALRYGGA